MRRPLSILTLLLLVGCGGDGEVTEPALPNARGTYRVTWAIGLTNVASGESRSIACPGELVVRFQEREAFIGDFEIFGSSQDCKMFGASGTIGGTVQPDGTVQFTLDVPGQRPNDFENLTGCEFVSGDTGFTGTISESELRASATVVVDCTDPEGASERLRIAFLVSGAKVE